MAGAAAGIKSLRIEGAFVYFGSGRHEDTRGFFEEVEVPVEARGCRDQTCERWAVQQSGFASSARNVLRGMHCSPYGKIVVCLAGEMWDVIVDLRQESATFLQWDFVVLSPELQVRLFVPPGVAHGYLARSDGTTTLYLKLGCYDKSKEIEINALDPTLGVRWPPPLGGPSAEYIVSAKDRALPIVAEALRGAAAQRRSTL